MKQIGTDELAGLGGWAHTLDLPDCPRCGNKLGVSAGAADARAFAVGPCSSYYFVERHTALFHVAEPGFRSRYLTLEPECDFLEKSTKAFDNNDSAVSWLSELIKNGKKSAPTNEDQGASVSKTG